MLRSRVYANNKNEPVKDLLDLSLLTVGKLNDKVSGYNLLQATANSSSFVWDSSVGAYQFSVTGLQTSYAPYINYGSNSNSPLASIISTNGPSTNYTVSYEIMSDRVNQNQWQVLFRPNVNSFGSAKLCMATSIKGADEYNLRNILVANRWYRFVFYIDLDNVQSGYFTQYGYSRDLTTNVIRHAYVTRWTLSSNLAVTNDASKIYIIGANANNEKTNSPVTVKKYLRNLRILSGDARQYLI
jgi:hypothetical protein